MLLYHYINGVKNKKVYSIAPGTPIEDVFKETADWKGTRLILVVGAVSAEKKGT